MKGPGKAAGHRTQGLETQEQMMHNVSQGPWGMHSAAHKLCKKKTENIQKISSHFPSKVNPLVSHSTAHLVRASRERVYIRLPLSPCR